MPIVYILTNPSMPGLIKIGKTEDLSQRLKQLYSTGVPVPFDPFYAARVEDADRVEKKLHLAFSPHRINGNREFFRLDPIHAAAALELVEIEDVTPENVTAGNPQDADALQKELQRAARYNFEMWRIPVGATLQFARDESITCTVASKNKVMFEGNEMSLSIAASKALAQVGISWRSVQGPAHWMYENETLEPIPIT